MFSSKSGGGGVCEPRRAMRTLLPVPTTSSARTRRVVRPIAPRSGARCAESAERLPGRKRALPAVFASADRMSTVSMVAEGRTRSPRGRPDRTGGARLRPLALVALAFTAVQVVFVSPRMGLGWDETVYVSQVSPHVPSAFFSAPRARGISLLVAPVTLITTSTVALRCYLAVLSGAGLFVALWAWRRLRPTGVLALAGVLFAGLWVTQFYGPQAMPNLWVALSGLAAV